MRLLVCISNVPDTTTRVKFTDNNTRLDTTGVQWVINPWDELSLTRALELKDDPSSGVESVTVAHVGPATSEPTIRKALAIGADDALRINCEASDAYYVAFQLSEVIRKQTFDLVLCGIESSDHNGSSVGAMLAAFLDWPSVSAVSALRIENGQVTLNREIDGGRETVRARLPLVAIVQKGIAREPRIAAMRGIMMARTKAIRVFEPLKAETFTQVTGYEMPPKRAACKMVDAENPRLLLELLQNEAKVI